EIWRVEGCPDCMPPEVGGDVWQAWRVRAFRPGGTGCTTCQGSGTTVDAVSKRWADPEGKDQRGVLQSQYDLPTAPAPKARAASFDALHERFAIREKWGTPGIVIHDVCANLIRETSRLTWRKTGRGGDVDRYETDGDDHAHDCLRYLCYALRRSAGPASEDEAPAPRS
ncbi:MAG: Terminase RNAseH like domain, partial [Verrucomicrobiota bacterium]